MRGLDRVCVLVIPSCSGLRGKSPVMNSSALWWALHFVLVAPSNEPLEPFMWASLNMLSLKTEVLLPLTSSERVSDLCALFGLPQLFADEMLI